mmetsp:Transcript_84041/g.270845  ORF Transcript_84041/g.270845 Transcript_84041/m.270845 type:complete len:105 (+) Transcript_84041:881-1195(+)
MTKAISTLELQREDDTRLEVVEEGRPSSPLEVAPANTACAAKIESSMPMGRPDLWPAPVQTAAGPRTSVYPVWTISVGIPPSLTVCWNTHCTLSSQHSTLQAAT